MSTIFACSTASGKAGVSIIRISGKCAFNAIRAFKITKDIQPNLAIPTKIFSPRTGELIDFSVVIYFKAPKSFTGEDVIEFHVHGSRAIINSVLEELSYLEDFRLAEAGEFSKRSFLNGKMDLTEAEGLADLIDATTKWQQKLALRQLSGELKNLYEDWRKKIIHIMAFLEAYIDFPDEDLPKEVIDEVTSDVNSLKSSIELHLADNNRGEKLREGAYAVILGAPNAGKSTMLNYLAKRDVAIVSNIAGTTRDILEVNLDIDGFPLTIADTAGIRESIDEIESEGIKRALSRAENSDIKILIATREDDSILNLYDDTSIVLINKADDIDEGKTELINNIKAIPISLKNKKNISLFLNTLSSKLEHILMPSTSPMITRLRHRKHLEVALENLNRFSLNKEIELACEDLRIAMRNIGEITGRIDIEEILDEIFSSFCIGK